MMLDERLKFDAHVDYICRKLYAKLRTLGRVRCYIGTKTTLYQYGSLGGPLHYVRKSNMAA